MFTLIVWIVIIGFALWAIKKKVPMESPIDVIFNIAAIIVALILLLKLVAYIPHINI